MKVQKIYRKHTNEYEESLDEKFTSDNNRDIHWEKHRNQFNLFYVCPKCKWEYDGVLRDEEYSIVNGSTLGNYRKNMYLMRENAYE